MSEAILNMWAEGKYSLADVGNKFNLSRERIRQILVKNGVTERYVKQATKDEYEKRMYGEAVVIVRERYRKGEYLKDAAKDVGVPLPIVDKLFPRTEDDVKAHERGKFFRKTVVGKKPDGFTKPCLEWIGNYSVQGVPRYLVDANNCLAHRHAWAMHYGEFPEFHIKRACKNRKCVEWSHLEKK